MTNATNNAAAAELKAITSLVVMGDPGTQANLDIALRVVRFVRMDGISRKDRILALRKFDAANGIVTPFAEESDALDRLMAHLAEEDRKLNAIATGMGGRRNKKTAA